MKVDIVITSYHRPDFTWRCLDNIDKYTVTPHRVIVVDNGSDQGTLDVLWDAKENGLIDVLVLLDKNHGLEPAKNFGLHHVDSEFFVDTDNDILVPPPRGDRDWLSSLLSLQKSNAEYAAIACPPQVFIGANKEEVLAGDKLSQRDFVGGSMRLMETAAVRGVGGWRDKPKDMVEANRSEELYICGKLREKGRKVGYANEIEVFHLFGTDDKWGYGDGVDHYHRDQWPLPNDNIFGTYEEWIKNYE